MKWMLMLSLLSLGNLEQKKPQQISPYPVQAEISILNKNLKAQEELRLELILKNRGEKPLKFCLPRRSLLSKQKTPYVFVTLKSTDQLCGQSLYTRISERWIPKNKDRLIVGAGQKHKIIFDPLEILVDCELERGNGLKPGNYTIQISGPIHEGCFKDSEALGVEDGQFHYLFKSEELKFEVLAS